MYMSEEYMCPLSLCLKTVLPIKRELRNNSKRVDVIENYNINNNLDIKLNDEQKTIVDILKKFYKQNRYSNHLIYGITGSGKTEVYIKLIEEVIKDNKTRYPAYTHKISCLVVIFFSEKDYIIILTQKSRWGNT